MISALFAVAEQSLLYAHIAHLGDFNRALLKEVEAFFVNYQKVRDAFFRPPLSVQFRGSRLIYIPTSISFEILNL